MRTVFEAEDEEVEEPYPQPDRELTLSSNTLLAIFFGLVLVCGLFFGLGYTLGRRTSTDAAALATPDASAAVQPTDSGSKPSPAVQPKSEAATQQPVDVQPTEAATQAQDGGSQDPNQDQTQPTAAAHVQPASLPAASQPAVVSATPAQVKPALRPDAASSAAQPVATQAAASIMVQIAAVANPADATVLVNALRKHGYTAVIRQQAGDSLQHVQVGPFSNRVDANAMRQKLLADGYNAFLK